MDKTKKEFQIALVKETAQRLLADGNNAAAVCLLNVAASMHVNAEHLLAQNVHKFMKNLLSVK